jgi:hypothetical protein
VTKLINVIFTDFFSTQERFLSELRLRAKKKCFEQLLHIPTPYCGKAVDWAFQLQIRRPVVT